MTGCKRSRGFTLVELLVVIAIIGVLVALLLPAVQTARESARRMQCANLLKQIMLACQNYESTAKRFPLNYASAGTTSQAFFGGNGTVQCSWMAMILPYMEQKNLYDRVNWNIGLKDASGAPTANVLVAQQPVMSYVCPSAAAKKVYNLREYPLRWPDPFGSFGATCYKSCLGSDWNWGAYANPMGGVPHGLDGGNGFIVREESLGTPGNMVLTECTYRRITDGTSNTIGVGESLPDLVAASFWYGGNCVIATTAIPMNRQIQRFNDSKATGVPFWGDGTNYTLYWEWNEGYGYNSRHPGGCQFAFVDGSVKMLPLNINMATYRALGTVDGGEAVTGDF
jgi:prepilin-type N-terminal cleavage/methylation domain-containing protein/prepilin-type processing-associated H-X9-DG protein